MAEYAEEAEARAMFDAQEPPARIDWEAYWAETLCPFDQTKHEQRAYVYECRNCGHGVAPLPADAPTSGATGNSLGEPARTDANS